MSAFIVSSEYLQNVDDMVCIFSRKKKKKITDSITCVIVVEFVPKGDKRVVRAVSNYFLGWKWGREKALFCIIFIFTE